MAHPTTYTFNPADKTASICQRSGTPVTSTQSSIHVVLGTVFKVTSNWPIQSFWSDDVVENLYVLRPMVLAHSVIPGRHCNHILLSIESAAKIRVVVVIIVIVIIRVRVKVPWHWFLKKKTYFFTVCHQPKNVLYLTTYLSGRFSFTFLTFHLFSRLSFGYSSWKSVSSPFAIEKWLFFCLLFYWK